ncbi:hypothetical protein D3C80_1380460 [compost metagenome]
MDQPVHGPVDVLEDSAGFLPARVRNGLLQNAVVIRLIQIGNEADRQPDAVICMRNLIDIF